MSSSRALARATAAHPCSRAAIASHTAPRLHRRQRGASVTRIRGQSSGGTPGGPRQGGEDSADASAAAAPSTSAPTPPDAANNNSAAAFTEDDVDALLAENWEQIKRRIARDLPPDQQRLMLDLTVDDLSSLDRVLNRFAEEFLGPYLAAAGVDEPPLSFFLSLLSIATALLAHNLQVGHAELGSALHVDRSPFLLTQMLGGLAITAKIASVADAEINRQALMIAYVDDFWLMKWAMLALLPSVFLLRPLRVPKGEVMVASE